MIYPNFQTRDTQKVVVRVISQLQNINDNFHSFLYDLLQQTEWRTLNGHERKNMFIMLERTMTHFLVPDHIVDYWVGSREENQLVEIWDSLYWYEPEEDILKKPSIETIDDPETDVAQILLGLTQLQIIFREDMMVDLSTAIFETCRLCSGLIK